MSRLSRENRLLSIKVTSLPIFVFVMLFYGCGKNVKITPAPVVDADYAFKMIEKSVSYGARPSGSKNIEETADFIVREIEKNKLKAHKEEFTQLTPKGRVKFRNIYVEIKGQVDEFLIIGGHYDTKRLESCPGFVGANDAGSSTGLLLALIKAVKEHNYQPYYTLRFIFFDGEECFSEYNDQDGLYGSRHHADGLKKSEDINKCKSIIVVDMIGDRDLNVTIPEDTDKQLAKSLFTVAEKRGYKDYFGWYNSGMLDDHYPFQKYGIPALDLIDFNFGPNNSYWHTSADTIDKVSPKSLKIVGDTVLALIWDLGGKL